MTDLYVMATSMKLRICTTMEHILYLQHAYRPVASTSLACGCVAPAAPMSITVS